MNLSKRRTATPPLSKAGKLAGIVGFVVGLAAVLLLLNHGSNDSKQTASQVSNTTSKLANNGHTSWQPYTSADDGFKVQFPGQAKEKQAVLPLQGISVPYDTHELDKGSVYWAVAVYKYPPEVDMSDSRARLEGALNGAVQNVPGATLASSNATQINGRPAIAGLMHISKDGKTVDSHATFVLNGNTMYGLLGINVSQADYTTFTNSFTLT